MPSHFGEETIAYIDKQLVLKCIAEKRLDVLFDTIHCNESHPSNHNVLMKNNKLSKVYIYEDEKWVVYSKHDAFVKITKNMSLHVATIMNGEAEDGIYQGLCMSLVSDADHLKTRIWNALITAKDNNVHQKNVESKDVGDGYLYIIQEREFVVSNIPIYKIGRTNNIENRLNGYPKSSRVVGIIPCNGKCVVDLETKWIQQLTRRFIHRKDIGNEYFEGDKNKMFAICVSLVGFNEPSSSPFDEDVTCISSSSDDKDKKVECSRAPPCKQRVFPCKRCGREFKAKFGLMRHLQSISECPCTFSNAKREDLLKELCAPRTQAIFSCKFGCGKCYNHQSSLCAHHNRCPNNTYILQGCASKSKIRCVVKKYKSV